MMYCVGMMHVVYPHLNRQTGRVKLGRFPPIVERSSEWIKMKTASSFLSAVHVHNKNLGEELLISRICRQLDIPIYSDQDETNMMFYIAVSQGRDLYHVRLIHAPANMHRSHPCALFLAVHALWDAGMVTEDLMRHIHSILVPTCDKSQDLWYNILATFVDDLLRTLAISAVLLKEKKLAEYIGFVKTATCCLENRYYLARCDKEGKDCGTRCVHCVIESHTCNTEEGRHTYISERAATEVTADVLHNGQILPPSEAKGHPPSHLH